MKEYRRVYLIIFKVGGIRFGVEATCLQSIAGETWKPLEKSQAIVLATVLGFSQHTGTRTLIVETSDELFGFVVDSIDRAFISLYKIIPVPPLLVKWQKPPILKGLAFYGADQLINVLDLERLANILTQHSARFCSQKQKSNISVTQKSIEH